MAKRKNKSILVSVMNNDISTTTDISNEVIVNNKEKNESKIESEKIEVQELPKLDDISNKNDELIRLSKSNSELTDKLASYIQELSDLKTKYEELKKNFDTNIIKISELTFENATLKAQINKLSDNPENSTKTLFNTQSTNVSYNQIERARIKKLIRMRHNGYSDWN